MIWWRSSLALLLLVAAIAWGIREWFPSEERQILRQFRDVARVASLTGTEERVERVLKAQRIGSFFTRDAIILLGPPYEPVVGSEGVVVVMQAVTVPEGGVQVECEDVNISLGPEPDGARAYLTVKVTGHDPATGEPTVDAKALRVTLRKIDGVWLVRRIEAAETRESRTAPRASGAPPA